MKNLLKSKLFIAFVFLFEVGILCFTVYTAYVGYNYPAVIAAVGMIVFTALLVCGKYTYQSKVVIASCFAVVVVSLLCWLLIVDIVGLSNNLKVYQQYNDEETRQLIMDSLIEVYVPQIICYSLMFVTISPLAVATPVYVAKHCKPKPITDETDISNE